MHLLAAADIFAGYRDASAVSLAPS